LAKANRLVRADDYRRLVRRGRRVVTPHTIVYVLRANKPGPVRFGFIVPKTVGIAVSRNLVRRRLKSLSHAALSSLKPGTEIVIRALPGAAQADWATLRTEISDVLTKDVRLA
jgi:ribonuclease P protein component